MTADIIIDNFEYNVTYTQNDIRYRFAVPQLVNCHTFILEDCYIGEGQSQYRGEVKIFAVPGSSTEDGTCLCYAYFSYYHIDDMVDAIIGQDESKFITEVLSIQCNFRYEIRASIMEMVDEKIKIID